MTVESHVLSQWLSPLESASLECDGFTLVASMLLEREGVPHQRRLGRVTVEGVGDIAHHYWIELRDGRLCDFKARMWLGDDPGVPHGVFENKCARVIYQPAAGLWRNKKGTQMLVESRLAALALEICRGQPLDGRRARCRACCAPGTPNSLGNHRRGRRRK